MNLHNWMSSPVESFECVLMVVLSFCFRYPVFGHELHLEN